MVGLFGGLVGLLVTIVIGWMIFKYIEAPTLERGKKAQDQAQQISGRGQDGRSLMESFKTEPKLQGSRLNWLLVTEVTPGGAADDYYGLKKGDCITFVTTQAGLQKIGEASNDDSEMAKMNVQQAFQAGQPIVVMRNGQKLTLPAPANAPVTAAPPAPSSGTPVSPTQGQPAPAPRGNPYDQINAIKDAAQNR
jgi:hypothetical protein